MNTVMFFSALQVWSLGDKIGAPSFFQTINGYVKAGWKVILFVPDGGKSYTIPGVDIVFLPAVETHNYRSLPMKFIDNIVYSVRLRHCMIQQGDKCLSAMSSYANVVIYAYEVHAVMACAYLAQKYNCPLVTRFQGTIMSNKPVNIVTKFGYYPHYQALKKKTDLVIMTDDGTQGEQYLTKIGNTSKLLFLRNGVDVSSSSNNINDSNEIRKNLGILPEEHVLMTLSRLVGWKRVDRAISSLPKVLLQKPLTKLVILGDGPSRSELEQLASSLGVSDNVIFVGSVNREEVPKYLSVADIFLSLYELSNVGNPLYEAMQCGKAIVTINNGDTGRIIEDNCNGILLEEVKAEEILPEVIVGLISDVDKRQSLGDSANKYAEANFWSWQERMDFEIKAVEKLLNH